MSFRLRYALAVAAVLVLTPIVIILAYDGWRAIGRFTMYSSRYPVAKTTIILSVVTIVVGEIIGSGIRNRITELTTVYAIVLVPILLLALYPGLKALGRSSDPTGST